MAISIKHVLRSDLSPLPDMFALRENDSLLHQALEASGDCIQLIDPHGQVVFINRSGLRQLGLDKIDALAGRSWIEFWPDGEKTKVAEAVAAGFFGSTTRFEGYCPTPFGIPKWWDTTVTPLTTDNGETVLMAISRDISERVQVAQTKDLLMQEIHHRIKNSLQLVQGLLSIQASNAENERAATQLMESAARVRTIGAMHDRLYRSAATLDVEVKPYLESLIADLRNSTGSSQVNRDIHLDADPVTWNAADIPTLGLVMTELVINALKYGAGNILVGLRQNAGEQATLTVMDEGRSLPEDFDPAKSKGLGMRLVQGLVRERGGQLSVERRKGHTCFIVRLPRASLIA